MYREMEKERENQQRSWPQRICMALPGTKHEKKKRG
jgi:hypothetical protein